MSEIEDIAIETHQNETQRKKTGGKKHLKGTSVKQEITSVAKYMCNDISHWQK